MTLKSGLSVSDHNSGLLVSHRTLLSQPRDCRYSWTTVNATAPQDAIAIFRRLHESGCFVLPNPWDRGAAIYLHSLGYQALATSFTVPRLADLGVRRISVGSALSRAAWGAFMRAAKGILEDGVFDGLDGAAPFPELNDIFEQT